MSTTLDELVTHLVDLPNDPNPKGILPDPEIGTRVVFRHVYLNRNAALARRGDEPDEVVNNVIGSVVIGGGGPGVGPDEGVPVDDASHTEKNKTLAECNFRPGDFISCAVMPPSELTGDVEPASNARMARGPETSGGERSTLAGLSDRAPWFSSRGGSGSGSSNRGRNDHYVPSSRNNPPRRGGGGGRAGRGGRRGSQREI